MLNVNENSMTKNLIFLPNTDEIINSSWTKKIFLQGCPGTGKTETLARRLEKLISNFNLNPIKDILILSFTREAVREIKSRIKHKNKDNQSYNVMTFDKYAWKLLSHTYTGYGKSHKKSYDSNILHATDLLKFEKIYQNENKTHDLEEWHVFSKLKYLIIDEIQDLTTARANFSYHLILRLKQMKDDDFGFLLLGDLNQEIFSYQTKNYKEKNLKINNVRDFIKNLKKEFVNQLEEFIIDIPFEKNPRYLGMYPENKKFKRKYLKILETSTEFIYSNNFTRNLFKSQVNYALPEKIEIFSSDDLMTLIKNLNPNEKNVLIFRTNRRAIQFSSFLLENKIKHQILVDKNFNQEIDISPIFARFFFKFFQYKKRKLSISNDKIELNLDILREWVDGTTELSINYDFFKKIIERKRFYYILKYIENGKISSNHYNINYEDLIHNFVFNYDSPLINYIPAPNVEITNFHRAKGREYDHIFVEDFSFENLDKIDELKEDLRVFYVGITRAKKSCKLMQFKPKFKLSEEISQESEFEEKISLKIDKYLNVDPFSFVEYNGEERQEFIWNSVSIGQKVLIYKKNIETRGKICIRLKDNEIFELGRLSNLLDNLINKKIKKFNNTGIYLEGLYVYKKFTYICDKIPTKRQILSIFKELRCWLCLGINGVLEFS